MQIFLSFSIIVLAYLFVLRYVGDFKILTARIPANPNKRNIKYFYDARLTIMKTSFTTKNIYLTSVQHLTQNKDSRVGVDTSSCGE